MGKQSAPLDGDLQRTYRGRAWRDEEPNRRLLLERWLTLHGVPAQSARALEDLASRLAGQRGSGAWNLADGWQLSWDQSTLVLQFSAIPDPGHGPIPPGE